MEPFISTVTEEEIKKEKIKARSLRKTQWWKRKCAEGVCYFCGRKISPKELTMEHVVPIIRGGKSVRGNVVPACKECNNRKKYLLPVEWEEYLKRLRKDPWS
jgi:5-methylcytosine-specific restriction endonuclease McrA